MPYVETCAGDVLTNKVTCWYHQRDSLSLKTISGLKITHWSHD